MPSPFPGMDPFLEDDKIWPTFHHHFIAGLFQILLPNLIDRYRARVGQRQYATEMPLFTSIIREEHCEEFIEIRQRSDNKLVTLVDVVSPSNKLTVQGKNAYLDRRRDARVQHASIVEIDLVLQGQPLLDYSREGLPDWDYAVTVTRAMQPERHEIYTATVQKRLPRFKLPLALDDRDTVVDLQAAFARCYDQGGFSAQLDYQTTPALIKDESDRNWVNDLLVQNKVRAK
jgi:Protein of unknown function (DUF4058)